MSEGKIFIPLDFREIPKGKEPIVFRFDDDDDPICVTMELFTGSAHVQMKLGDASLDLLFDKILENRLELAKKIAFRKGAARGARSRRKK